MPGKKLLIAILLVVMLSAFLFVPSHEARAALPADFWYWLDNFVIRPILRKIVNALENRLLNAVNDIVSDKLNGALDPHFITDWRNNVLNSASRGVDISRSIFAETEFCSYFSDNLKTIFGAKRYGGFLQGGSLTNPLGTEPFQYTNRCNLNFNVDAFKQDFSNGGWEAWNQLIQPNNNIFGTFGSALQEQLAQTALEKKSSSDENVANNGFIANRLGLGGNAASGCAVQGTTRCVFLGKTVSPGQMFSDVTRKFLDQKFETIGGSREIADLILAIADAVISKISGSLDNFLKNASYAQRAINTTTPAPGSVTPPSTTRNTCLNNCNTQAANQCAGIVDPTQRQTCENNAYLSCIRVNNCP